MRTILGLAVSAVAAVGSAQAAEEFRIGGWQGRAALQRNGVVTECSARMDQTLGAQIALALDRDGLFSLTLFHPHWNFLRGRDVGVQLGVDMQRPDSVSARVLDRGRLRLTFEDAAAFDATLRQGRTLNVKSGPATTTYRLDRIGEVLDKLRECIALTGDALPVAVPPPEEKKINPFLTRPEPRPRGGDEAAVVPRRPPGALPMPVDDWPAIQKRAAPMPAAYKQGTILAPQDLYKLAAPSVYLVLVDTGGVGTWNGLGSAVAISADTLLTNCHVVGSARRLELRQGEWRAEPTILAGNPGTDRCFLRVAEGGLKPVRGLRPGSDLIVGEPAYTLGNPSGLDLTFGEGIVSAMRNMRGVAYVQTSAPSSPGSSGGALFDARGNLIGITTLISWDPTRTHVFHFAIAADEYWR